MSNVKRMDIWTVVRTILEKNPGIKGDKLWRKVREKTDLSRSTIYGHLSSFELKDKIYREKGRYWLEKPSKQNTEDVAGYLQLLKQLEEKLGSKVDLAPLRILATGLNGLTRSGARVSKREAEIAKLEIERIIIGTEMQMNEDEYELATGDLLDALGVHLKLAVDSLVKQ